MTRVPPCSAKIARLVRSWIAATATICEAACASSPRVPSRERTRVRCSENRIFVGKCLDGVRALKAGDEQKGRRLLTECTDDAAATFPKDERENAVWYSATPSKVGATALTILGLPRSDLQRAATLRTMLYFMPVSNAISRDGDLRPRVDINTCWPCRMLLLTELANTELRLGIAASAAWNYSAACDIEFELRDYSDGPTDNPCILLSRQGAFSKVAPFSWALAAFQKSAMQRGCTTRVTN